MRRIPVALLLLLVFASAATGVQVHASTECERWIAEYRSELAHSNLAKHANAARQRLHHYVHRKVAAFYPSKPKPKVRVLPARLQRPKMSHEEMLRALEFACGELPVDPVELAKNIDFRPAPAFLSGIQPDEDMTGPVGAQDGPQGLLPSNDGPGGYGGSYPIGGIGGWGGGSGGGTVPGNPGGGNPPTAVAPEPGSLLLLATGLIGAAGMIRRHTASVR